MKAVFSLCVLVMLVSQVVAGAYGAARVPQKPSWIPVTLNYTVPPGLKAGDEVRTVFAFTATSDVPTLEIELHPISGLEWLDGEKAPTFQDLKKGERREVAVRLRLTDAKGRLALSMSAVFGESRFGKNVLVDYGGPRP